jgi:DNA modification methylase
MPAAVPRFAIEMMTRPGDLVLDPFFGSGATGAAAQELGRRWVGIDHHMTFLEGAAFRPQFEAAEGYERKVR